MEDEIIDQNNDLENNKIPSNLEASDINKNKTIANKNTIEEVTKKRIDADLLPKKAKANIFEKYINDTGIASAFELIFSEIIYKKIAVEDHYTYAAGRLRQIGREIELIKQVKNK